MNNENKVKTRKALHIGDIMRLLFKKREPKTITITIPRNWMNCAITTDNNFISDTNNSSSWDYLRFPLPKPKNKWEIKCYVGNMDNPTKQRVMLVDKI